MCSLSILSQTSVPAFAYRVMQFIWIEPINFVDASLFKKIIMAASYTQIAANNQALRTNIFPASLLTKNGVVTGKKSKVSKDDYNRKTNTCADSQRKCFNEDTFQWERPTKIFFKMTNSAPRKTHPKKPMLPKSKSCILKNARRRHCVKRKRYSSHAHIKGSEERKCRP